MLKKIISSALITILFGAPVVQAGIQHIDTKIKETNRIQKIVDNAKQNPKISAGIALALLLGGLVCTNDGAYYLSREFINGAVWPYNINRVYSKIKEDIEEGDPLPWIPLSIYIAGATCSTYCVIKAVKYLLKKNKSTQSAEQKVTA